VSLLETHRTLRQGWVSMGGSSLGESMLGRVPAAWRDWLSNGTLLAVALVATMAISREIDRAADPSDMGLDHGRHLASSSAYDGAKRSLQDIWDEDNGPVKLILTYVLVIVLGSLAAGAGVGGGGLFVPIYWLVLNAGPKGAVPLSKATILGGAVGNFLSISRQRHPKASRPMIDYESSTYMQSGELLGVVFGVLLNKLLPAIVIIVFLILILSFNSFRTIKKGIQIRKKETAAFAKEAAKNKEAGAAGATSAQADSDVVHATPSTPMGTGAVDPPMQVTEGEEAKVEDVKIDSKPKLGSEGYIAYGSCVAMANGNGSSNGGANGSANGAGDAEMEIKVEALEGKGAKESSAELTAILEAEACQFPLWAWALLASMTSFQIAHSFISKVIQSSSSCVEYGYWLWYITPVFVLSAFMVVTAVILHRKHTRKEAAGFPYLEADMQWTTTLLLKFPKTALMAGITAGLLGIGGGMIIGPLFLSIGMEPQVGTSSCAFMILWTALSGVIAYGADDNIGWELAITCVSIGFISGQIGQRLVNRVLKETGRPSYVVFLLGGIIGAATIAMSAGMIAKMVQGDYNADDKVIDGEPVFYIGTGFGCDPKDDPYPTLNSTANASGSTDGRL